MSLLLAICQSSDIVAHKKLRQAVVADACFAAEQVSSVASASAHSTLRAVGHVLGRQVPAKMQKRLEQAVNRAGNNIKQRNLKHEPAPQATEAKCSLLHVPPEALAHILRCLPVVDLAALCCASRCAVSVKPVFHAITAADFAPRA
jgi:hypothetical protein